MLFDTEKIDDSETKNFPSQFDIGECVMFVPDPEMKLLCMVEGVIFTPSKVRYNLLGFEDNASIEGVYSQRVIPLTDEERKDVDISEVVALRNNIKKIYS